MYDESICRKLVKYMMTRHEISSVVDGLCGVGSFAIHFGKYLKVVAIDINENKVTMAQLNAEIY